MISVLIKKAQPYIRKKIFSVNINNLFNFIKKFYILYY